MKNKECVCGGTYELKKDNISEEGVVYEGYKCNSCSDVILDMEQARVFYKALEKIYSVKLSKWGESLAVRIPAAVARSLRLKPRQKARIIQEEKYFKVVPA